MNATFTISQIVSLCLGVSAVWGVFKIILEMRKPSEDLKHKVEEHENIIQDQNGRLQEIENTNRMLLQCMFVMINHEITGNSIDSMKEVRDDLQEFLIKK